MKSTVLLTILVISGCNLSIDTDSYPYQRLTIVEDTGVDEGMDTSMVVDSGQDMGMTEEDMSEDADVDMAPVGEPDLMITEILINTSEINALGNGEVGEFIEVKNVGTAAADPRKISFQIASDSGGSQTISVPNPTNADQLEVYEQLQSIQPGDYFVFVRFVTDGMPLADVLPAGTFFDYGRAGITVALANSGERILTLQYFDGRTIRPHDSVRWSANALRPTDAMMSEPSRDIIEDVALSVGREFESPMGNNDPSAWCDEITEVAGPGTFFGSPGQGAICSP
ncbi:MAG: hypothetical protein R3E66_24845 [bacterium]